MSHSNEPLEATLVCHRCGCDLPRGVALCAACANCDVSDAREQSEVSAARAAPIEIFDATSISESHATSGGKPEAERRPDLTERPAFLLGMIFGAALFLGLPWLWKCRAFSNTTKTLLTVLVLIETVVLFWLFYLVMSWSIRRIAESL